MSLPSFLSRSLLTTVLLAAVAGLGLTALGVYGVWKADRNEAALRFHQLAERLGGEVQRRMNQSLYGLKGARGLYADHDRVTRGQFAGYVGSLDVVRDYPGVLGFGFIEPVEPAKVESFLAAERTDAAPDFTLRTSGHAAPLYVIKFIEPLAPNRPALGYDVGSEPLRRAAAEAAIASGEARITARITLVQDTVGRAGFLYFLPVYRNGTDAQSPAERRAALLGLVYAPILIDEVFAGLTANTDDMLDVEAFEGPARRTEDLLLDADDVLVGVAQGPADAAFGGRMFHQVQSVQVGGREWTLVMTTTPKFERSVGLRTPVMIGVGGFVVTALFAGIVIVMGRGRARALGLAREMTSTLRAREAEAQRLAIVAARTSNAVVITDANGAIEWVNEGFTRITGYTLEEVKGRKPGSLLQGPETSPVTRATMAEALARGEGFEVEILNYHKTGRTYWLAVEVQPLRDKQGRITGFMAVESDITERKQAVEKLQQAAERAEQANRAKSEFLATMSHEIRTPMNGVIGMTSLLLDTPLNPQQREFTEIVRSSGETLLSLINDILDFSKIESGRMELEKEPFSLAECVESTLDLFAARAGEKGLDLHYEIAPGTPEMVGGDVTRLRQILVNLIGNAVKFTHEGEIEVTVTTTPGSTQELQFAVRDTGIGIPGEAQGRLFQSFTQVDASTTRKYGGTGLGLAISHRLAEIMGGRMWIESEPGRGSTFFFTVKIDPATAPLQPPEVPDPGTLRGKRLLIVDNNATGRRILATLAERWGTPAVLEERASAALTRLQSGERFDLALLDMVMPEVDGIMLGRAIRQMPAGRALPLVLLSSIGRKVAADDARLFAAALSKPVKPAQLFATLCQVVGATARPAADAALPPNVPAPPVAQPLRVLLAEDNPVNQKVALYMLARFGYRADTAVNGVEVLDAWQRQPYDVVLMDVQMPEMDGLETTRRIRAGRGKSRPWIIALTANATKEDRELCTAAGMDDYVSKPLKVEQLLQALQRAALRASSSVSE